MSSRLDYLSLHMDSDLRRTFIRMRVLKAIHPAKLFPSAERVDRMIKDEEDALKQSERNLTVRARLNVCSRANHSDCVSSPYKV